MTIVSSSSSLVGLVFGALGLVVVLGIGGVFVVVVVANRAEADPSGRRPFVVYLFGVAFITLWTALLGSISIVAAVVNLIGGHRGALAGSGIQCRSASSTGRSINGCPLEFRTVLHPIGDAAARGVVAGGLLLLVSAVAFYFHVRKGLQLAGGDTTGPSLRVVRTYVSAVSFVSVLIAIFATMLAIYAIFEIAAPGVFGGSGRIPALRYLIDAGYVALSSGAILAAHLRLGLPRLWPWRVPTQVGPWGAPGTAGPGPYPAGGPPWTAPAPPPAAGSGEAQPPADAPGPS